MAMAPFTKVEDSGRAGLVVEDDGFIFRRVESRVPERHPNRDIRFALPHLDLLSYLFSPKQFAEDCHFYKNSRYCTNVGPSYKSGGRCERSESQRYSWLHAIWLPKAFTGTLCFQTGRPVVLQRKSDNVGAEVPLGLEGRQAPVRPRRCCDLKGGLEFAG